MHHNNSPLPSCPILETSATALCGTILRDFLNFSSWQHQKRSSSARLPLKMESWVQSWRPRTNAFCDFSAPSVQSAAPATKKRCQVIRSAAPVRQNHLRKPEDLMLQNATPLRKSAPRPPNISDEHVFCIAPATWTASFQILFKCPTLAIVFGNATRPSRFAHFCQGAESPAPVMQNLQKWSEHVVLLIFWIGIVLPATTACTFSTSCSEPRVLCAFWLGNVLRATTAGTFSSSQLPKVVRTWCVLYMRARHELPCPFEPTRF